MKARRVALGGSILRDLRAAGYEPVNVASWTSVLKDVLPIFGPEGEEIPLEDRYDAAIAYGVGGDARLRDFEETWVPIPAGTFLMGAQSSNPSGDNFDPDAAPWEGPVVPIAVAPFEIRKYLITVEEFERFVSDDGYHDSARELWNDGGWNWRCEHEILTPLDWEKQRLAPNCPVTGISWHEADAYCRWLTGKELRRIVYRLPSESEWEYAAKYGLPSGQQFPWGSYVTRDESAEVNCAWCGLRRKTPVGMFPKSTTTLGIADMFGNVEEWSADLWAADHTDYPNSTIEWKDQSSNPRRVTRGGSTIRFSRLCRPTYRTRIRSESRYHTVGFRPIRVTLEAILF